MVELYCTLIIKKVRRVCDIPDSLYSDVIKRLGELGYDERGDKI